MLLGGVFLSSLNIGLVVYNNISGARLPILLPIHSGKKEVATFGRVRLQLGEITALGLEVLVVADILETLTKLETEEYTWVALGKIGEIFFTAYRHKAYCNEFGQAPLLFFEPL